MFLDYIIFSFLLKKFGIKIKINNENKTLLKITFTK